MANAFYTPFLKKLLDADVDFLADDIKVVLVDLADYTFSAAHEFLSDVAAGARVATSGNLASKTTTGGVFDAADLTFTAVTGDPSEALIIYKDTGVAATSPLIRFMDTGVTGLPITPSGADITIRWNAGGIISVA